MRRLSLSWVPLALGGCWWMNVTQQAMPAATSVPQVQSKVAFAARPLPGWLDDRPLFDSNSPEVVTEPGTLLAVAPTVADDERATVQERSVSGDFRIFSHHIAKDATPGARLLHLGMLAMNRGTAPVTFAVQDGASYLSQPDALFKDLPTLVNDMEGTTYGGPGDRVVTDLLHGRSPLPRATAVIPPGGSYLVYDLTIPTNVAIPPPINGRTTLISARSDGPVALAEVALFADRGDAGFATPTQADFLAELSRHRLAGPRDVAPTDPTVAKPKGGFKYGRVAGVARGNTWNGRLFVDPGDVPAAGARVGFPIASLALNKLGTDQVQSATLDTRYPDTAYAAHGNYGVTYQLLVRLANPDASPRTYALRLSQPLRVEPGNAVYADPPNKPVTFRGPVKLSWTPKGGPQETRYVHVVLHAGEQAPPFASVTVPAGETYESTLTLIYPADATPPQLLTVER